MESVELAEELPVTPITHNFLAFTPSIMGTIHVTAGITLHEPSFHSFSKFFFHLILQYNPLKGRKLELQVSSVDPVFWGWVSSGFLAGRFGLYLDYAMYLLMHLLKSFCA